MATNAQVLDAIYNAGERLVPGETHDRAEIVRHKSSYQFFRRIIESDILSDPSLLNTGIRILDIGCGTGHGTFMLSSILGAKTVGIDPSIESIQYAKENYYADNIEYVNVDAEAFVSNAPQFDYVVSRHALEHVEDGLNIALKVVCHKRLMVNVPFNESEGNIHHKVHWIKESDFGPYSNKEFFYEGLDGITTLVRTDENPPNSIVCISSAPGIRAARDLFDFPFLSWQPEFLQDLGIRALEAGLNRREAGAAEKEAQLSNHETNLRALEAGLNRREAGAAEREAQLSNHETNLRALEADLNQREAVIVNSLCGKISRIFRKLKGAQ